MNRQTIIINIIITLRTENVNINNLLNNSVLILTLSMNYCIIKMYMYNKGR